MDSKEERVLFFGDLSDPWVAAIVDSLPAPATIQRVNCSGDLPDLAFDPRHAAASDRRPSALCERRRCEADQELVRFQGVPRRAGADPLFQPLSALCGTGALSNLFDQTIPEATAADVLPGRVARLIAGQSASEVPTARPSFRVEIACGTDELGDSLVETCADAGYRVEKVDDAGFGEDLRAWVSPVATTERVLTIWEVPVLKPGWADRLGRRAIAMGPIIGLMGFAERSTVTLAKANGACACLELPSDRDDLLEVIDRVTRSIPLGKWPLPPRAEPPHVLPPRSRRRVAALPSSLPGERSLWSDQRPPSTIV